MSTTMCYVYALSRFLQKRKVVSIWAGHLWKGKHLFPSILNCYGRLICGRTVDDDFSSIVVNDALFAPAVFSLGASKVIERG